MRRFRNLLVLAVALAMAAPATAQEKKRNLLIIGQSQGYQHDAITDAMATLYNIGRTSGKWDTCFRTDCKNVTKKKLKWGAKNLDDFDAIAFFTDGDLDMDDSQKADLLSFIRDDGKGFIGIHSAAITFLNWPEYGKMLGGYFDGHPWGIADAPLVVEDTAFPGMKHLPASFTLKDEIYQIKDFSRDNVRVLLRLDEQKIDLTVKGIHRKDGDFAVVWARDYGKGRVLYNGLGHVRDVWDRPDIQKMWLDMVQWSMGIIPGDAAPRPQPAPTPKDLGDIQPPGGVPLDIGRPGAAIKVDGLERAKKRLESVPPEDLAKWVVELERIMDKKLDGDPSKQACRTYFVSRMSVAFDDLKWNVKAADALFQRARTMPAMEAKVWKEAFEGLLKKEIGQTATTNYDGGPAYAVPLVLIPIDALHEGQKYSAERGKKYLARLKQLTAEDVSLWKDKVDKFGCTELDAAVNIILLDDYFGKELFQREKFKAAIVAGK